MKSATYPPRPFRFWRGFFMRLCCPAFAAALFALAFFAHAEDKQNGRQIVVVAFGDSLTNGYRLPAKDGFAPQLQEQLQMTGLNATVINAGNDGDTSADGLNRTDWMLEDKPAIVVVEFGGNDMLRGLPVARMRDNLDAIVGKIKASGAKVLLAGMYALGNSGAKYREEFEKAYAEVAEKHNVLLYPFFLQGAATKAGYKPKYQLDPIHPNAEGVKIIAKNIAPFVIEALEK